MVGGHGRFTLGLGSGEALNEHIIATGWPGANIRQARLVEGIEIISRLFDGGSINYQGKYLQVDSAKLWDLPDVRVPIGIAVSGRQSCEIFGPLGDVMIGIDPEPELTETWDNAAGGHSRKVAQLPISWDSDVEAATSRAHQLFRWSLPGWKVNAELPGPAAFAAAAETTRPEDVAAVIPCGNDVGAVVQAAKRFFDAGYTDLALVQVGADQQESFFAAATGEILPELRKL